MTTLDGSFVFDRLNLIYLTVKQRCWFSYEIPKDFVSKPKPSHKIVLQPINKENLTRKQLDEFIKTCYPLAEKYNKNHVNIHERNFKAAKCARQGILLDCSFQLIFNRLLFNLKLLFS